MPLAKKDRALLQDMRQYALEAKSFAGRKSEAAYMKDILAQRACERAIEVIGEAASHLSMEARELYPQIPFDAIIGMRNVLAHGYIKIDHHEIWKVLKHSIPDLLRALDKGPDIS
jgi:uncharacterized protein with HEPN domain